MKRTGFTLIELLVVIAVIALLLALLTAALQASRARAKAVLCGSNIRQLALGLFMYADQNETFPCGFRRMFSAQGGYLGSAETDALGLWWHNYIEDFAKKSESKERVFCCPSKNLDNPKLQDNILWGNYGVNRAICRTLPVSYLHKKDFTGTPLGVERVPHPGRTLLIVDSGHSLVNWWYATDIPPVPLGSSGEDLCYIPGLAINTDRKLLPSQLWDAIKGRHPHRTVNVGFADGHVARVKAQELLVENSAETYRNITPLWVPEEKPGQ